MVRTEEGATADTREPAGAMDVRLVFDGAGRLLVAETDDGSDAFVERAQAIVESRQPLSGEGVAELYDLAVADG